jgi:predicted phage gp36 major capsid-like protein
LSSAPYRLAAIQSIELYLNALLLSRGHEQSKVRGSQHDLAARTDLAIEEGLKLRKRTADHLRRVAATREYLVTRYGPEISGTASQVNRLTATMDEVAKKGTVLVPNSSQAAVTRAAVPAATGRI